MSISSTQSSGKAAIVVISMKESEYAGIEVFSQTIKTGNARPVENRRDVFVRMENSGTF